MHYPNFFDEIKPIVLQDKLSHFLGTFEEGVIEFSYLDVVKLAGHSCPTVAGAYLMVREGLKALYGEELPQRGEIEVSFKSAIDEGTTGVVANIAMLITGATDSSGFKGLNGNFSRTNLMHFEQDIEATMQLKRKDTQKVVNINYDPSSIPPNAQIKPLMGKMMQGVASGDEKNLFGILWQVRVEEILKTPQKVVTLS